MRKNIQHICAECFNINEDIVKFPENYRFCSHTLCDICEKIKVCLPTDDYPTFRYEPLIQEKLNNRYSESWSNKLKNNLG